MFYAAFFLKLWWHYLCEQKAKGSFARHLLFVYLGVLLVNSIGKNMVTIKEGEREDPVPKAAACVIILVTRALARTTLYALKKIKRFDTEKTAKSVSKRMQTSASFVTEVL